MDLGGACDWVSRTLRRSQKLSPDWVRATVWFPPQATEATLSGRRTCLKRKYSENEDAIKRTQIQREVISEEDMMRT